MAKRSLNEKKTAINNIRSRVHLACDDALPDPCVMHILILNFRNSKDFNKIQRISSHILSWKANMMLMLNILICSRLVGRHIEYHNMMIVIFTLAVMTVMMIMLLLVWMMRIMLIMMMVMISPFPDLLPGKCQELKAGRAIFPHKCNVWSNFCPILHPSEKLA